MTLLHVLHARLDLDDGVELVHDYGESNAEESARVARAVRLAFLPKQQRVGQAVKHVYLAAGFICASVSVTLESGNVRGFEQTAVVLALSGPAPLPNAFNLGAELLDVFTS